MKLRKESVGSPNALPEGSPFADAGRPTLLSEVVSILRRPGIEAHAFIPGAGWISGLALENTIMEDGTQAASVDNPIGYMGDPIATVGPELVTNGDFSAGSTGWTAGTGWSIGGGVASAAGITADGLRDSPSAYVTGRAYQVSFDKTGTASMNIYIRTSTVTVIPAGTTGRVTVVIVAGAEASRGVEFYVSSAVATTIDNISVRELVGAIPARQATTAKKPILRRGHVNRIRNSTMVGAVAGTPGTHPTGWAYGVPAGISRSIVGTGSENGLTYIDVRFFGTASAANDVLIDFEAVGSNIPALIGQALTVAATISLVAGAWPTRATTLGIIERNSGNTFLTLGFVDVRSVATGSTPVRVSHTRTLNQATTAGITAGVRCNLQIGDVIDFTVRIAAPQLEQGSVANTFVPTTTAAASASTGPFWAEFDGTDFMSLAAVPFQVQDDFCVVAAFTPQSKAVNGRLFSIYGAGSGVIRVVSGTDGTFSASVVDDAGAFRSLLTPGDNLGVRIVGSVRHTQASSVARKNGVPGVPMSSALAPTSFNGSQIGAQSGGSPFTGGIFSVIAIRDAGGVLTDADVSILERYVAQASGVQL